MPVLVLVALMIAVAVNLGASALVAQSYRGAIRRLMSMGPAISEDTVKCEPADAHPPDQPSRSSRDGEQRLPSIADLQKMEKRLWSLLCGLSVVLGLICSLAWFISLDAGWKPFAWMLFGLMMASPGLVLQMELMRWPLSRQFFAGLGWVVGLVLLFSMAGGAGNGGVLVLILPMVVIPFVLFRLLFGSPELRGIAPFLFAPVFTIVLLALIGQELLSVMVGSAGSIGLGWLLSGIGAVGVFLLFSLLPVIGGGVPLAHRLSHWLGRMYRSRSLSDFLYLYGSSWIIIAVIFCAIIWQASPSVVALVPLLGWGIIPFFFGTLGKDRFPAVGSVADSVAPMLLVLRVFQRPGSVGWLFDHIVQRWRFIGPVALISGTDLASRTVEPHLLVDFLEGHLQRSYIQDDATLRHKLASVERQRDLDGRYRIGEFFCYATTWEKTLMALMRLSSCVLMDLRGFAAHNKGCQFELQQIASSGHLMNVVILVDQTTDRNLIEAILAKGRRPGHVHSILVDADRIAQPSSVLKALLA